jgi:hypothetical protein
MNIIDVVIAYRFVTILSTPWTSMEAFKYGIIDKKGKILKKRSQLSTPQEKAAYPDVSSPCVGTSSVFLKRSDSRVS